MITVFYQEFLCGEKCLDQLIQRLLQSADEEAITEFLDENLKSVKVWFIIYYCRNEMSLHQEVDPSKEVFLKVDKVQLKIHSTHKNIFLMNQVTFLDLRVLF